MAEVGAVGSSPVTCSTGKKLDPASNTCVEEPVFTVANRTREPQGVQREALTDPSQAAATGGNEDITSAAKAKTDADNGVPQPKPEPEPKPTVAASPIPNLTHGPRPLRQAPSEPPAEPATPPAAVGVGYEKTDGGTIKYTLQDSDKGKGITQLMSDGNHSEITYVDEQGNTVSANTNEGKKTLLGIARAVVGTDESPSNPNFGILTQSRGRGYKVNGKQQSGTGLDVIKLAEGNKPADTIAFADVVTVGDKKFYRSKAIFDAAHATPAPVATTEPFNPPPCSKVVADKGTGACLDAPQPPPAGTPAPTTSDSPTYKLVRDGEILKAKDGTEFATKDATVAKKYDDAAARIKENKGETITLKDGQTLREAIRESVVYSKTGDSLGTSRESNNLLNILEARIMEQNKGKTDATGSQFVIPPTLNTGSKDFMLKSIYDPLHPEGIQTHPKDRTWYENIWAWLKDIGK